MNLEQIDREYVLQTYPRNYVNFVSGNNATLQDSEGNSYIDFSSGIGVVSVGHANERISTTISKQAANIIHISNLFLIEPQALLGKKIAELSGMDVRTFFANSGAEANEGAIKIARKYGENEDGSMKRYKIITLEHSFHGRTITALKATGQEAMHNYFGPYPDGFVYAESIDHIVSLCDDHTVAVMIELVQGEGGVEPLDKAKVQALATFLKQKDILLIVDEVQTGVYRTGAFLASQYYNIIPDVITLAKGLGGGVPIGAIVTTHKEILGTGDHGSTFGGNYLCSATANTVLDILSEHDTNGQLQQTIDYFSKQCEALQNEFSTIFVKSVGVGMMRGLRVRDADTLAAIIAKAFDNGVVVLKAGRNTLRFLPPLTITHQEIDRGMQNLRRALETL
jgi:acetylornithine aminotransferase